MRFAQLISRANLGSIEAQLTAFNSKLYHAGIKEIPKSTLANMNEKMDWHIYQDYAMVLVQRVKVLYKDEYYRLGIDKMVVVIAFSEFIVKKQGLFAVNVLFIYFCK